MNNLNDPIGLAIQSYHENQIDLDIIVKSDICEDDIIPLEILFRKFDKMPALEKIALDKCEGNILDVGACAGPHCIELIKRGFTVHAIDISKGAISHLKSNNISAELSSFLNFNDGKYDTILMLMNGIGMAGKLKNLEKNLKHAYNLLNESGKILCDSSDIRYLYEQEDGSLWMDLNAEYYGNFRFQMQYKTCIGPWFDWLYVDYDNLHQIASSIGFKSEKIHEENQHYLAQLTKI